MKRKDTPKNIEFWEFVEETAREVRSWPKWKRGGESAPEPIIPTCQCGNPIVTAKVCSGCDRTLRTCKCGEK